MGNHLKPNSQNSATGGGCIGCRPADRIALGVAHGVDRRAHDIALDHGFGAGLSVDADVLVRDNDDSRFWCLATLVAILGHGHFRASGDALDRTWAVVVGDLRAHHPLCGGG